MNGGRHHFDELVGQLEHQQRRGRIPSKWMREIKRAHKDMLFIRDIRHREEDRQLLSRQMLKMKLSKAAGLRAATSRLRTTNMLDAALSHKVPPPPPPTTPPL